MSSDVPLLSTDQTESFVSPYVHLFPIIAIVGYLMYPKNLRIDPSLLHCLSVFHNLLLTLFSAWTFVRLFTIVDLQGIIRGGGADSGADSSAGGPVIRPGYYFQNPDFDRIIFWFTVSKYYEFLDTFLLYLNGKTPIFLQTFHHIGAVVCWHFGYVYSVDVIWIPSTFNAFVHTLMYSYYLGCLLKIRQVRFIKRYLTSLQLFQLITVMTAGNMLYFNIENKTGKIVILMWVFYTIILIVLFGQFYRKTYLTNTVKRKPT